MLFAFISANKVSKLNNRLNRFWTNQELIYYYKSTLTRIGISSSVDDFDVRLPSQIFIM